MDKYLIIAFRSEIATAILNSQQKLNPNGDAYIDKDELPKVLEFFGKTDVKELLQDTQSDSNNSIFTNYNNESDKKENDDFSKYTELLDSSNAVLREDGTAAEELQNVTSSDLITSSVGTPYEAQMKSLYERKKELLKKDVDTSAVEAQIDALNEAVQEYIKIHQHDITQRQTENGAVKQFHYGNNGEKTGYYVQVFGLKANNTTNKGEESENDSENNKNEENAETSGNQAVGGITYNIEVATDKLHAIGHIEADTENTDVSAVAVYKQNYTDDESLNFSGNFRQTIERGNNRTNLGGSVDYKNKKFSTGGYATYKLEENENEKEKVFSTEGYLKHGKSLRGAISYLRETDSTTKIDEFWVGAKASGIRKLNNNNITLSGALTTKYGIASMIYNENNDKDKITMYNINGCGGISFKSSHSDFTTNILANVNIDSEKSATFGRIIALTASLLGNISTDKIDVTATLTTMNYPDIQGNEDGTSITIAGRKTNWASSITIGLKKLFGKNVIPSFTYNLNSDDIVKHTVAANLGINF